MKYGESDVTLRRESRIEVFLKITYEERLLADDSAYTKFITKETAE
jgi:hypothetical protein